MCDFGWCAEYQTYERRETVCGTYEYMAPEILMKKSQSTKIDVWALGVLIYELIHGFAPFPGKSMAVVRSKIYQGKIKFDPSLSKESQSLVKMILRINPLDRPDIDKILEHEWFKKFQTESEQIIENVPLCSRVVGIPQTPKNGSHSRSPAPTINIATENKINKNETSSPYLKKVHSESEKVPLKMILQNNVATYTMTNNTEIARSQNRSIERKVTKHHKFGDLFTNSNTIACSSVNSKNILNEKFENIVGENSKLTSTIVSNSARLMNVKPKYSSNILNTGPLTADREVLKSIGNTLYRNVFNENKKIDLLNNKENANNVNYHEKKRPEKISESKRSSYNLDENSIVYHKKSFSALSHNSSSNLIPGMPTKRLRTYDVDNSICSKYSANSNVPPLAPQIKSNLNFSKH